ncbi:hypothetical protein [Streptacidiphilus sp. P02-A3a]|nr:hypothetical protein [Streptacidiphilus sp. P02-A3a]QMU72117.1 hypothetical protein GXP74_31650 [Streptacidiphilus sp. P02-A3a]
MAEWPRSTETGCFRTAGEWVVGTRPDGDADGTELAARQPAALVAA